MATSKQLESMVEHDDVIGTGANARTLRPGWRWHAGREGGPAGGR